MGGFTSRGDPRGRNFSKPGGRAQRDLGCRTGTGVAGGSASDHMRRLPRKAQPGEARCRLVSAGRDRPALRSKNYAAKNKYLNSSDRGTRIQKPIENDGLPPNGRKALFEASIREALAFALPGAACYATVPSGPLLPYFISAFEGAGLSFKHLLVWVKQQFVIGMSDYHYRHEAILYGWVESGPHYFTEDRTQNSVFEIDRPLVSDLHPTTKPVELLARMIANSSLPGEIIYDPFCGSGSTIVAAHQLGRVAYGCEIDPGYVAVTLERLSTLGLKPKLIGK